MADKKVRALAVTKEQLLAVIAVIELACTILMGVVPILKGLIGKLEKLEDG